MFTTDLLIDLWLYILFVIVIVSLIAILNGVYMMVLLMMLSLLLLIPYVIKSYQYGFVKYLLADNPQLKGTRARQLSTMLTNGEKGSIFVLDLSFIGWYLLGALCLGLGHLFVNPYYEATRAELYIFLRERAIQNGLIDPRELNLYTNPPIPPYGMPPQQKDTTYVMYQKMSQAGPNSPYGTVPPVYPGSSVPTQGPVQDIRLMGYFKEPLRIRLTGRRPLMGGTLPHIREIWFPRRHRTACRRRNPKRPSRRFREAGSRSEIWVRRCRP